MVDASPHRRMPASQPPPLLGFWQFVLFGVAIGALVEAADIADVAVADVAVADVAVADVTVADVAVADVAVADVAVADVAVAGVVATMAAGAPMPSLEGMRCRRSPRRL